jgi:hypothetical protein
LSENVTCSLAYISGRITCWETILDHINEFGFAHVLTHTPVRTGLRIPLLPSTGASSESSSGKTIISNIDTSITLLIKAHRQSLHLIAAFVERFGKPATYAGGADRNQDCVALHLYDLSPLSE